mmetsp:Transcript_4367/g.12380  ORF Transcript_4367/g.12380 Transcript_4367/m.12380 type:complete len:257 (-) Transcript_4367:1143-1913(-)
MAWIPAQGPQQPRVRVRLVEYLRCFRGTSDAIRASKSENESILSESMVGGECPTTEKKVQKTTTNALLLFYRINISASKQQQEQNYCTSFKVRSILEVWRRVSRQQCRQQIPRLLILAKLQHLCLCPEHSGTHADIHTPNPSVALCVQPAHLRCVPYDHRFCPDPVQRRVKLRLHVHTVVRRTPLLTKRTVPHHRVAVSHGCERRRRGRAICAVRAAHPPRDLVVDALDAILDVMRKKSSVREDNLIVDDQHGRVL